MDSIMSSRELNQLRGIPAQQQSAFNIAADALAVAALSNNVMACAAEGNRAIARSQEILDRANQAALAIKVASFDAMAFSDAGKPTDPTINSIERMLNHGVVPEAIARKLVERRDTAGIKYLLDTLWSVNVKDMELVRRSIEAATMPILSDSQRQALLELKETESNMASVIRNHNDGLKFFQEALKPTFVQQRAAPPQRFSDWGVLDEQGNYSFAHNSNNNSVLDLRNGYEQFAGQLVGTTFQNAKPLHR
jgi:hypothetical protein